MAYKFQAGIYYGSSFDEVWVAVGESGSVAATNNVDSWTTYQLSDTTDTSLTSVAYGKDTATGATMWMIGTNNAYVTSGSEVTTGASAWSDLERIINTNSHRALQFGDTGDGVWVMATRAKLKRNVSGSWDVPTTDLNLNRAKGIAQDGAGKWALAATVYNTGRPSIWKSLDDGVTWSEAWNWPTNYGINYTGNKDWNIAYKSDKWVAAFPSLGIVTGSITAGPSDSGAFSRVFTSSEDLRYIAAGGTDTWMAIDRARNVYISTDNAATWSTTTSIPGSDAPSGLAYNNGTWVVVTDGTVDNILKSTNNGSSWTAVASTGYSMHDVAVDRILP